MAKSDIDNVQDVDLERVPVGTVSAMGCEKPLTVDVSDASLSSSFNIKASIDGQIITATDEARLGVADLLQEGAVHDLNTDLDEVVGQVAQQVLPDADFDAPAGDSNHILCGLVDEVNVKLGDIKVHVNADIAADITAKTDKAAAAIERGEEVNVERIQYDFEVEGNIEIKNGEEVAGSERPIEINLDVKITHEQPQITQETKVLGRDTFGSTVSVADAENHKGALGSNHFEAAASGQSVQQPEFANAPAFTNETPAPSATTPSFS